MTVLDFVRLTRAHLLSLVVLTLVGAGAAYAITVRMPEVYLADASGYVVVGGDRQSTGDGLAATTLGGSKADSYLPLVTGRAVAQRAIEATGIDASPAEVAARVDATVAPNSVILKVRATGPTPEESRMLADAVIAATAEEADRIEQVGANNPRSDPLVQIVPIEAALPGARIAPIPQRNVLVGAFVGLLVGYLVLVLRRQLDTRVRTVADVEELVEKHIVGGEAVERLLLPNQPHLGGARSFGRLKLPVVS